MRELLSEDIYALSEIIDKTEIEFPSMIKIIWDKDGNMQTIKKTQEEFGLELAINILKKIYKAKKEINKMLESILSIEDATKLTFKETKENLIELFSKEEIKDFFK